MFILELIKIIVYYTTHLLFRVSNAHADMLPLHNNKEENYCRDKGSVKSYLGTSKALKRDRCKSN